MKKEKIGAFLVFLAILAVAAGAAATKLRNVTLQLGSSNYLTGAVGNSGNVQQAGTMASTAGRPVCADANANTTTSSCGLTAVSTGTQSSVCSTASSTPHQCSTTVTISPSQPDTSYLSFCSGDGPSGSPFLISSVPASVSTITVVISNGTADQAQVSTYANLHCLAIHP